MVAISADLSRLDGHLVPDALAGMGGGNQYHGRDTSSATYDPVVVQGSIVDRGELDRQIELYRSRDADARRAIKSACSRSVRR